jgi:hypothetical protein
MPSEITLISEHLGPGAYYAYMFLHNKQGQLDIRCGRVTGAR